MIADHVSAGIYYPGRLAVKDIAAEIERQRKAKIDVLVDSRKLEFVADSGQFLLRVPVNGTPIRLPMTRMVHNQMAEWIGIRQGDRLYKWLFSGAQRPKADKEDWDPRPHWQTAANLYNDFLHTENKVRTVRIMQAPPAADMMTKEWAIKPPVMFVRALLSDKYMDLSNADMMYAIADACREMKAQLWHARLGEDSFHIYAVAPHIEGQIRLDRTFDPGDGWQSRWYGKAGDTVNAALAGSNSETGGGCCEMSMAILRRVCMNYSVHHQLISKSHVGAKLPFEGDAAVISEETVKLRNAYFFSQIKDHVRTVFDPDRFRAYIAKLNEATQDAVKEPEQVSSVLHFCYDISEERAAAIRDLFVSEKDMSRYGVMNAVTNFAQGVALPADVGFALERMSTDIAGTEFAELTRRASAVKRERDRAEKREKVAVA